SRGAVPPASRGAAPPAPRVAAPPQAGPDDRPGTLTLAPRFTAPARVTLRYVAADGRRDPVTGARIEAGDAVSPVAGFLMPDYVDGSVELFDAAGAGLGRLRGADTGATVWEDDPARPGRPGRLGADPDAAITDPAFAALATGLVRADRAATAAASAASAASAAPTALGSLLKVVDTTWWTIDFTGQAGDEHLALLLGHPVAALRAELAVEVADPAAGPGAADVPVEVRLGALDRFEDGLVGYVLDGDPGTLRVVDPSVPEAARASGRPLADRYVTGDPLLVRPGRPVALTLLVAPDCQVHVRTGLLPAKAIGMRRAWVAEPLARLTPSFRYGPVLTDREQRRLPLPSDVHGTWSWLHRPDPFTWAADEVTARAAAGADGSPPARPPSAAEGWLRLALADASWEQYGVRVDVTAVSQVPRLVPGTPVGRIGGTTDGRAWSLTADHAIELVRSGRFEFWIQPTEDGNPAGRPQGPARRLQVVADASGAPALATTATAGDPADPLLALPETGVPEIVVFDPANTASSDPKDARRRYALVSRRDNTTLDVAGGPLATAPGGPVVTWAQYNATNQQFAFRWHDHGGFTVTAWHSGQLLTAEPPTPAGVAPVTQRPGQAAGGGAGPGQLWHPVSTGDGHVVLYRHGTTRCLTAGGAPLSAAQCTVTEYRGLPEQQWKIRPADVDTPSLNTTPTAFTLPATVYTDQGHTVTLRFRNTGNSTWRAEDGHALAPYGDFAQLRIFQPGWSSGYLPCVPVPGPVAPGEEAEFTVHVQAPHATGVLYGGFQMVTATTRDGVPGAVTTPWGQATDRRAVTVAQVTSAQLSASIGAYMPFGGMATGDAPNLWIAVTNTGTVPWHPALGHRLAALPVGGFDRWGVTDGDLREDVLPGQTTSVPVEIHPTDPGVFGLQLRMFQAAIGGFFGDPGPSWNLTVSGMTGVALAGGAAFPDGITSDVRLAVHVVLNAAAPHPLTAQVVVDNAPVGTVTVAQGALASADLTLPKFTAGTHAVTLWCGGVQWKHNLRVTSPKKAEKSETEKIGRGEKLQPKEKDADLLPPSAGGGAAPYGEPRPPGTGPGATPWISAEHRPDVGGDLYDDGQDGQDGQDGAER
ncbi:hypothetical protein, partial [Actinomadura gamaensis]